MPLIRIRSSTEYVSFTSIMRLIYPRAEAKNK